MTPFIDDADIKTYFPLPMSIDTSRLNSIINMTQITNVRDLLGDSLYQYVLEFVENGEPSESPVSEIIIELKTLHCMHVAKAVFSVYYKDEDENKRDYNISYISGNINALSSNIIKLIKSNSELLEIALISKENVFDADKENYETIYYDEQ